jgi:hypothetical protein
MIRPTSPKAPKDRFDVYRFFNGISAEVQEGAEHGRSRVPLVKTFLLEHVSSHSGRIPKSPVDILAPLGVESRPLDDQFWELSEWHQEDKHSGFEKKTAGYLEKLDERFFAFYTADRSEVARKKVHNWVARSPELDLTWFSGPFFQSLWDRDVSTRGDSLFTKLVFRHESVFDLPEDLVETEEDESEVDESSSEEEEGADQDSDEDRSDRDRRKVRSELKDRVGHIRKALTRLQDAYTPLHALYALRLPSLSVRGGHDLYQMGRITNHTESFEDHRNTVCYLYRTYKTVLETTEKFAWLASPERMSTQKGTAFPKGVPLIINFGETLSPSTFNRWISLAFRKRNPFRLWGDPIRLGPIKVHVFGADRHLWQPLNLELTANRLVAILPKGTCGNTFHRLVTNVQQYVCPKIDVWLGAKPFHELMTEAQGKVGENHECG